MVSPISERKSFEELAVMFEGSTASGAERAYRRAVEKLTVDNDHEVALSLEKRAEMLLVERNQLCKLEKQSTH